MGFRVGRQHPLHFTDQLRVPAARPSDKTDTISRRITQGGFEDFPNLLVVLRTDCAVRLIHLGLHTGSACGGARVKRQGATYNSGSSWTQVSFWVTSKDVMPDSAQITAWLALWRNGDEQARERLFETVHIQLRQMAATLLQRERGNHTLEPNALVNEVCVRLLGGQVVSYQDRAHFFAIAAQTMRRILIDHARAGIAGKRGGGRQRVSLSGVDGWTPVSREVLAFTRDNRSIRSE